MRCRHKNNMAHPIIKRINGRQNEKLSYQYLIILLFTDETTITIINDQRDHRLHDVEFDGSGSSVLFISALAKSAIFSLTSNEDVDTDDGVFITIDGLNEDRTRRALEFEVCTAKRRLLSCTKAVTKVLHS